MRAVVGRWNGILTPIVHYIEDGTGFKHEFYYFSDVKMGCMLSEYTQPVRQPSSHGTGFVGP
jgi:hypothetical protein